MMLAGFFWMKICLVVFIYHGVHTIDVVKVYPGETMLLPCTAADTATHIMWVHWHKPATNINAFASFEVFMNKSTFDPGWKVRAKFVKPTGSLKIQNISLYDDDSFMCHVHTANGSNSNTYTRSIVFIKPNMYAVTGLEQPVPYGRVKLQCEAAKVNPREMINMYWEKSKNTVPGKTLYKDNEDNKTYTVFNDVDLTITQADEQSQIACIVKWNNSIEHTISKKIIIKEDHTNDLAIGLGVGVPGLCIIIVLIIIFVVILRKTARKADGLRTELIKFESESQSSSLGNPPKLLADLEDVTIVAPEDLTLECNINRGDPVAKISWFKDAKEVYPGGRVEMSFEDEVASLTIHDTVLADAGKYRCEAGNKLGRIQSEATVTVHGTGTLGNNGDQLNPEIKSEVKQSENQKTLGDQPSVNHKPAKPKENPDNKQNMGESKKNGGPSTSAELATVSD